MSGRPRFRSVERRRRIAVDDEVDWEAQLGEVFGIGRGECRERVFCAFGAAVSVRSLWGMGEGRETRLEPHSRDTLLEVVVANVVEA